MQHNKHVSLPVLLAALLVVATGSRAETPSEITGALYHSPAEKRELTGIDLPSGVSIGGLVETEVSFGNDAGETISDIALATFELDIDARLHEQVYGHVLLLWEEDDTEPVDLDEATIAIAPSTHLPLTFILGKMYIPFGAFNSHFISDPLVLDLAETRESAILAEYTYGAIQLRTALFKGDMDDNDQVSTAVFAFEATPCNGLQIGASWISDICESDLIQETILNRQADTNLLVAIDAVAGVGANLHVGAGSVVVDAEYITATEELTAGVLSERSAEPSAWNVELAFHAPSNWEVAVKIEGTRDLPDLPERQYGCAASTHLHDNTTLAIEFLHGDATDETTDRDIVTAQFALEF